MISAVKYVKVETSVMTSDQMLINNDCNLMKLHIKFSCESSYCHITISILETY